MPLLTTELDDAVHVGDVGTELVCEIVEYDETTGADVAVDVSGATELTIYLTKPNGTVLTKTASLDTDGLDGKIVYATISGDLSVAGTWRIQAYVAGVGGWSGSSREASFVVKSSRHG